MRNAPHILTRCAGFALFLLCLGLSAPGQDSQSQGPPLGDIARKTRKAQSAPGHVPGKTLVDEEEDGPDTTGVWRVRLCTRTPCYELSVTLPKNSKWSRGEDEPRPVLIPLPGHEQDSAHVIRLYVAEAIGQMYTTVDGAKRIFLQGWFSRPEYFGQPARISLDEHVQFEGASGTISHFTVTTDANRYRGLSIVAATSNGAYGFACVFGEQDVAAAASVCDAIINSAQNQILTPVKRPIYPNYDPPAYYRQADPPDDPPETEDPE